MRGLRQRKEEREGDRERAGERKGERERAGEIVCFCRTDRKCVCERKTVKKNKEKGTLSERQSEKKEVCVRALRLWSGEGQLCV